VNPTQPAAQTEKAETAQLVRAAQNGCTVAFDQLAIRFGAFVLALARRRLENLHDAEDEAQNVLTEAFVHLHTLQDPAKFQAWLKRLVRNRCIDRLRRKLNVESCVEFHDDVSQAARIDSLRREERDERETPEVADAVTRLSAPLRETLELHYFQNCSLKEISARLNVPLSTVKRRLHDARQKLREKDPSKNSQLRPNLRRVPFDVEGEEVDVTKFGAGVEPVESRRCWNRDQTGNAPLDAATAQRRIEPS